MIDRWLTQLKRDLARMIECYETDVWDFNLGDSCSSYSGCMYKPLCMQRHPENWLSDYETRVWNPLELVKEA